MVSDSINQRDEIRIGLDPAPLSCLRCRQQGLSECLCDDISPDGPEDEEEDEEEEDEEDLDEEEIEDEEEF